MIEVTNQEMETGEITVALSATDYDSGMLYYDYSYDGGETFAPRLAWGDKTQDTITFTIQVPPHIIPQIVVRGYNGYDLFTESNLVSLPSMDYKTEEEIAEELAEQERAEAAAKAVEEAEAAELERKREAAKGHTDTVEVRRTPETEEKPEKGEPSVRYFLTVCLVCALSVVGMTLAVVLMMKRRRRRRKRRRRKHR